MTKLVVRYIWDTK